MKKYRLILCRYDREGIPATTAYTNEDDAKTAIKSAFDQVCKTNCNFVMWDSLQHGLVIVRTSDIEVIFYKACDE